MALPRVDHSLSRPGFCEGDQIDAWRDREWPTFGRAMICSGVRSRFEPVKNCPGWYRNDFLEDLASLQANTCRWAARTHDRPTLLVSQTILNRFPSPPWTGISSILRSLLSMWKSSDSSSGLTMGICGKRIHKRIGERLRSLPLSSSLSSQTHLVEVDLSGRLWVVRGSYPRWYI